MVLGTNSLEGLMKKISAESNLSKIYSNHSIRATAITVLDSAGLEARHIMSVSGHKAESSIRSYSKTSDEIKRKMSEILSSASSATSSKKPKGNFDFDAELYKKLGADNDGEVNKTTVTVDHNKENKFISPLEQAMLNYDDKMGNPSFSCNGEAYVSNCSFNFTS